MHIVLFEDHEWSNFLPMVYTRPVGDLRCGLLTTAEKWQHALGLTAYHGTRAYLRPLFAVPSNGPALFINARLLPDEELVKQLKAFSGRNALVKEGRILAFRSDGLADFPVDKNHPLSPGEQLEYQNSVPWLQNLNSLHEHHAGAIEWDFSVLTRGRKSAALHESNLLIGPAEGLFIEEDAQVWASTLNTTNGPVYIGRHAEVMEGSHVRGPLVVGEHSQLKMGSRIYGPVTLGPHCKVGGEVSASIFHSYSNKAHDGFVGNSLTGAWCNMGAGTETSNLKNNYSPVKVYSYATSRYENTGLTFCGLVMADHSKCGINTMFNTGTVAGVSANIFGSDFPPRHIPSFAWGGAQRLKEYPLEDALATAERVKARRQVALEPAMREVLRHVFSLTASHRHNLTT